MAAITCPTGCSQALPSVSIDECNPEINYGEIKYLYIALPGQPLTLGDAAEFTTRLAATDDTKIIKLKGAGDMPAGSGEAQVLSSGYRLTPPKDRTLNFTVYETNDTNYAFARQVDECGGKFLVWPATNGGQMYGGNEGIEAYMSANLIIPRGDKEVQQIDFTLSWSGAMPDRKPDPNA